MLYSFMSFSCQKSTLAEALELAARIGYHGFEPRIGNVHTHGVELETDAAERARQRRLIEASGAVLSCIATPFRFANPATVEHEIARTEQALALAADLGAPRLRVFGGAPGEGVDRAAAIAGVAGALRRLGPIARARGVKICLETHDSWTDPDHVAAVMEVVDDEAVGVVWDVMHPLRTSGWAMRDAWARLRPWIDHVHMHDGLLDPVNMIFRPIGRGEYDLATAFACLAEMDYAGFASGEWIACEDTINLGVELAAMRRLEAMALSP